MKNLFFTSVALSMLFMFFATSNTHARLQNSNTSFAAGLAEIIGGFVGLFQNGGQKAQRQETPTINLPNCVCETCPKKTGGQSETGGSLVGEYLCCLKRGKNPDITYFKGIWRTSDRPQVCKITDSNPTTKKWCDENSGRSTCPSGVFC